MEEHRVRREPPKKEKAMTQDSVSQRTCPKQSPPSVEIVSSRFASYAQQITKLHNLLSFDIALIKKKMLALMLA